MKLSIVIDEDLHRSIVKVFQELGFANVLKFPRHRGMIILRFPNVMSTEIINREVMRLLQDLLEEDYKNNLIIVSPGNVRIRHPALK